MSLTQTLLRSPALAALTSPHGVDRYLELVNPMWAAHEVRARIVDIHREVDVPGHPAVATLTLRPTSTWRGHAAGQHVQLGVEIDGARRTTRVFSVSSPASGPGEPFTITLRANPDGVVSRFLVERARPGQLVHLSQAQGEFVLPDQVPDHVLLVSGGSGITPVMSMLRTLQRRTHRGRVTFLHYAQSPRAPDLRRRARGGPAHRVRRRRPPAPPRARRPGAQPGLPGAAGARLPRRAHLGVRAGTADHRRAGGVRRLRHGSASSTSRPRPPPPGPPRATSPSPGRAPAAANTGATLLEQAEALGLSPAYGCRMGICLSCTSVKTEGTVRNVVTGAESSLPDEDIQICVSQPVGDCAVDL